MSLSTIFQSFWDAATASWVFTSTLGTLKYLAQENYTEVVGYPGPLAPESKALPLNHGGAHSMLCFPTYLRLVWSPKSFPNLLGVTLYTVMTLCFQTDRSGQTVQTQIRLLQEEQSNQGLHCLLFHLHHFDKIP